jgi:hypothetical protein
MKLYEIVAPAKYSRTVVDPKTSPTAYVDKALRSKGAKELGYGSFAHTFQHKDSPYPEVYRASRFLDAGDAHSKYIDAIQQNEEIRNNPYAPRVHSIRHVSKPNLHPQEARLHRMERLIDIKTMEFDEVMHMFERMFRDFRKYLKDVVGWTTLSGVSVASLAQIGVFLLFGMIGDKNPQNVMKYIKDPNLMQMVEFLRSFKDETECILDLGINNVMVRRTQYGPHLVFTDPFC